MFYAFLLFLSGTLDSGTIDQPVQQSAPAAPASPANDPEGVSGLQAPSAPPPVSAPSSSSAPPATSPTNSRRSSSDSWGDDAVDSAPEAAEAEVVEEAVEEAVVEETAPASEAAAPDNINNLGQAAEQPEALEDQAEASGEEDAIGWSGILLALLLLVVALAGLGWLYRRA